MQYILILKNQIGSLLNKQLENPKKLPFDRNNNGIPSPNLNINLHQ